MSFALLLHGFSGAPSSFARVIEALPGSPSISAPRLLGHGTPPAAPEVASFDAEIDRLARLIPAPSRALVAGYSLGARLALGLLARHPERCAAAVLISGRAGLGSEAERAERRTADGAWQELLRAGGLEHFVARWEAQALFATQRELPEAERAAERARRFEHTADGLSRSLAVMGLAEMPDYAGALAGIRCPVEVLAGALDTRFSAHGKALAAAFERGRFTSVPGAGHNLLLERPQAVAEAIARGLQP